MNVFDLAATLTLDSRGFDKGISISESKASGLASKLGGGFKTAAKVGAAAVAAVGVSAIAAGEKIVSMANDTAEAGDRVDKMSQKIGISRKSFQELDYVFSQSGANVDSLKIGLKTMRTVMDTTAQGTSKTATALERLGVSAVDEKGKLRDSEEVMWESMKTLQGMTNQTEKARLASMLFGKAGSDMMPLLNGTAGSVEELKNKANELGLVMSDKAVDSARDYTDSIDTLKRTFSAFKNNIMAEVLPSLSLVANGFTELIAGQEGADEKFKKGFSSIIESFTKILPKFVSLISTVANVVIKNAPSIIKGLANGIVSAIPTILPTLSKAIIGVFSSLTSVLPNLVSSAITALVSIGKSIAESLPTLIPQFVTAILSALETFLTNADQLYQVAVNVVNGLISGLLAALPIFIEKLPSLIKSWLSAVLQQIPILIQGAIQLVEGVVSALPDIISALVSAIPSIITSVIDAFVSNLPQLIQGAIQLVISLITHLPEIILALIEAIPTIITSIIDGFLGNIDKLVLGAIDLVVELVKHLPEIIWGLIKAIPKIVMSIVNAFGKFGKKFLEIGANMIKGIWDGIVSVGQWLWEQISGFFGGIVDGIKDFFGIKSPSRLFRDQIGKQMAKGLGLGFAEEMKNVSLLMQDSIPTDFDVEPEIATPEYISSISTYDTGQNASLVTQYFNIEINNPQLKEDTDIDNLVEKIDERLGELFRQRSIAYG